MQAAPVPERPVPHVELISHPDGSREVKVAGGSVDNLEAAFEAIAALCSG